MLFGISYQSMIVYMVVFIFAIMLLALLASPLKRLFKILIRCIMGTGLLIVFNFIGGFFGFTVGLNLGTILTVGILGIPGFALVIFLRSYLY